MSRKTVFVLHTITLLLLLCLARGILQAQSNFVVAILVVDDFTGVDLSALDVPQSDACAVSLEGQAFFRRGAAAGDPITEPHGELVYAQFEEMVTDLQAEDFVRLVRVDVQGLTTEDVAAAIEQAMLDEPADVYVVNMSFALIPCDFITDLAGFEQQLGNAARANNQNDYRAVFQRAVLFYDQTVFPVNAQSYQEQVDLDPLQAWFDTNNGNVVPIASAGNFGLDYPFWPGAWGQVVSVSGSAGSGFHAESAWDQRNNTPLLGADTEVRGRKGTRISNFGEIMLPGEYESEFGHVVGTSFAAPRLSMAVALYLSSVGGDYCRGESGTIALDTGEWDNLTLTEAAETSCPDLLPHLPS